MVGVCWDSSKAVISQDRVECSRKSAVVLHHRVERRGTSNITPLHQTEKSAMIVGGHIARERSAVDSELGRVECSG